jgi:hypothetical protein
VGDEPTLSDPGYATTCDLDGATLNVAVHLSAS